jgi:hypothetical protein
MIQTSGGSTGGASDVTNILMNVDMLDMKWTVHKVA